MTRVDRAAMLAVLVRALVVPVFFALLLACGPRVDAELFDVEPPSDTRLEAGRPLTLRGEGFPAGREVEVRFEGTLHRPGREVRHVEVSASAAASSPRSVELQIDRALIDRLGGRGTFRGTLYVMHEPEGGIGRVTGHVDGIALDVIPPAHAFALGQGSLADRLGLIVGERGQGEDDVEQEGLPIVEVAAGSAGERAGLAAGHRIVSVDGLRVFAPSELEPIPGRVSASVGVTRSGDSAVLPIDVALPVVQDETGGRAGSLVFAFAFLLAVLLLALPMPPGLRAPSVARPWRARGVLAMVVAAVVSAALSGPLSFTSLVPIVVVAASARIALLMISAPSARARWSAALGAAVFAAAVSAALAPALILAGTPEVEAVRQSAGALPTQWLLLRAPGSLVGLIALGLAFTLTPPNLTHGQDFFRKAMGRVDDLCIGIIAACVALTLFGGGQGAGRAAPAIAALEAGLAAGVFARIRSGMAGAPGAPLRGALAVAACAGSALATSFMFELGGSESLEQYAAMIGLTVLVCLSIRAARERPAAPLRPAQPLV